jgi:hypothetical protein
MISIREQDYGLDVALFNEFTLADFTLFEEALMKRVEERGRPNVLLDLTELKDFTLDMALEELKFVRAHEKDFGRIAILVSDIWIKLGAHISGLLTHTNTEYFDDVKTAQRWLEQPVEA